MVASSSSPTLTALTALTLSKPAELARAITEHMQARRIDAAAGTTSIAVAVDADCERDDVARDVTTALAMTKASLATMETTVRAAAPLAYADLFSAERLRSRIEPKMYERSIAGFAAVLAAPAPQGRCADANATAAATLVKQSTTELPNDAPHVSAVSTTVRVTLDRFANPIDTVIYQSSGYPVIDRAALGVARRSQYRAPSIGCTSVDGSYDLRVDSMDDGSTVTAGTREERSR